MNKKEVKKMSELKYITLQDGEKIYVDSEDFERVKSHVWYRNHVNNSKLVETRIYVNKRKTNMVLPTFIMRTRATQIKPGNNFSKDNLTTKHIQRYNQPYYGSASRYKGVTWAKVQKKWVVAITVDGKRKHLGYFVDEDEAGQAYNNAVDDYWDGQGFKNIIGVDNRLQERTYKTDPRFKNNSKNQIKRKHKYSGIKTNYQSNSYVATVRFERNNYYVGNFKTQEHAGLAYNKCVMYLYGNDARLNDIPITDELKEFINKFEIPKRILELKV